MALFAEDHVVAVVETMGQTAEVCLIEAWHEHLLAC